MRITKNLLPLSFIAMTLKEMQCFACAGRLAFTEADINSGPTNAHRQVRRLSVVIRHTVSSLLMVRG